jgi:hypothetical protein
LKVGEDTKEDEESGLRKTGVFGVEAEWGWKRVPYLTRFFFTV